ncbi:MAG: hypothetical protein WB952_12510 [Terriglobales bacterium]
MTGRDPLDDLAPEPSGAPARHPPLPETSTTEDELKPGDRVEALGNFGKPLGTVGTVQEVDEDGVVVLWDNDARMKLGRAWVGKHCHEAA